MWAWIVPILVELLAKFIELLLQKWLTPKDALGSPTQYFQSGRDEFLKSLKWKFWLGPKRLDYANKLYNKALASFVAKGYANFMASGPVTNSAAKMAYELTNNLYLDSSEL